MNNSTNVTSTKERTEAQVNFPNPTGSNCWDFKNPGELYYFDIGREQRSDSFPFT